MKHSADATKSTPETSPNAMPAAGRTIPGIALSDFIAPDALTALIQNCREEDLGPLARDITSLALRRGHVRKSAVIRACVPGSLCGLALLPPVCHAYGADIHAGPMLQDGATLCAGEIAATLKGPLTSLLALERVALNFITLLSGITTLTALYTAAVAGTGAVICDTRKTHPGLRALEKYAVACGGGCTHRMGLYDAALLKDNHIGGIPESELASAVTSMVRRLRDLKPPPLFVAVEVDTIAQFKHVLGCGIDIILLDNMPIPTMRKAVALRRTRHSQVLLEASGGITMANVGQVAATGIDRISIGALTHSAKALDFTMEVLEGGNDAMEQPPCGLEH